MTIPAAAHDLVQQLALLPHPEGGWYRETYRAAERISAQALPPRFKAPRVHSTAIYFLLHGGTFSAFHRIKSDELWHFYAGDPLTIHVLHLNGRREDLELGPGRFQQVVPAGAWFASRVMKPDGFTLAGCTVAPGFDFADFEMATRAALIKQHPKHAELIRELTRE